MEFDERLQRTLESLTARLHQEIAGQLKAAGAELSAAVRAEREAAVAERAAAVAEAAREARAATEQELTARTADDLARAETQAREAIARAETQARAEVQAELAASHTAASESLIESHKAAIEHLIEGHQAESERRIESHKAASERLVENHKAASERLIEAIRTIDGAKSLTETLDALVASTGREVGRAAMFLLQGSTLKSWRLVGFDEFGATRANIELPVADAGLIAEAVETGRVVRVGPGSPRSGVLPAFVDLPDRSHALAVPLMISGQALAVLYVDDGNNTPTAPESWPATIEVLARHAARALEAITAARLAQVEEVVSR